MTMNEGLKYCLHKEGNKSPNLKKNKSWFTSFTYLKIFCHENISSEKLDVRLFLLGRLKELAKPLKSQQLVASALKITEV